MTFARIPPWKVHIPALKSSAVDSMPRQYAVSGGFVFGFLVFNIASVSIQHTPFYLKTAHIIVTIWKRMRDAETQRPRT
jgi:hypothetical protein